MQELNHDQKHECGLKIRYAEKGLATSVKIAMEKGRGEKILSVYLCRHCGYWHVGHNNSLRRRFDKRNKIKRLRKW